jgi:hypothetical protein
LKKEIGLKYSRDEYNTAKIKAQGERKCDLAGCRLRNLRYCDEAAKPMDRAEDSVERHKSKKKEGGGKRGGSGERCRHCPDIAVMGTEAKGHWDL